MEVDPWKWLTTRRMVIFIILLLVIYVTIWTMYFFGFFPEAHRIYDKGIKTESGAGEAR
jgi:hypothetical protein